MTVKSKVFEGSCGILLITLFFRYTFIKIDWSFMWGGVILIIFGSTFFLGRHYKPNFKHNKQYPPISIIIPAFNEQETIGKTIQSILEASYPNKKQIIVANDGSQDQTWNIIKKIKDVQPLNFVHQGKRKTLRNAIVNYVKHNIIVLVDSDSYLTETSLTQIIDPLLSCLDVGAVVADVRLKNKNINFLCKMQDAWYYSAFRFLKATESKLGYVTCCSGCLSAYRRNLLVKHVDEWCNETFLGIESTYGDDRALTNYIVHDGYKTIYNPQAKVFTNAPETLKKFVKQQIRWKKGWIKGTAKAITIFPRRGKLVALFYLLNILVIFSCSFSIFYWFIIRPILIRSFPIVYVLGVMWTGTLYAVDQRLTGQGHTYFYRPLFSLFYLFVLSWLFPYALLTIKDNSWLTR